MQTRGPDGRPGQPPELIIERMRLALPPGYAGRAAAIARRVASEIAARLSRDPLPRSHRIGAISLPPLAARPGETDAALAIRIAGAIRAEIARGLAARTLPGRPATTRGVLR